MAYSPSGSKQGEACDKVGILGSIVEGNDGTEGVADEDDFGLGFGRRSFERCDEMV